MEVIYGKQRDNSFKKPVAVGLGTFDGLHVGHMVLINILINQAKMEGCPSVVYTFTEHPENVFRKDSFTPLLTTVSQKINLLAQTDLDYLYFEEFDKTFSMMPPETFVKEVLVDKLSVKLAVAGFDYTFGYRREGNVDLLKELGVKYGFKVIVIPPIKLNGEVVSSTLLRDAVSRGDMEKALIFLGRNYSITGQVTIGKRLGSTLGFPTANVWIDRCLILPRNGVYITRTLCEGKLYPSITNIGQNPTLDGLDRPCMETHLLDFDDNIYGKDIEVFFIKRMRDEIKFSSKEELAAQVHRDILSARNYFNLL